MDLEIPPAEWDDLPLANRGESDVPRAPMAEHDGIDETNSMTNTIPLMPLPDPQPQQRQQQQQLQLELQQHDVPDRDNIVYDANRTIFSVGDTVDCIFPPNAAIQQHKLQQGGHQSSIVSPGAPQETTSDAAKPSPNVATIAITAESGSPPPFQNEYNNNEDDDGGECAAVVTSSAVEAAVIGGQGRPAKQNISRCRAFSAGYCPTSLVNKQYCKHGLHDAAGAEKERRAWLAAVDLAPSVDWGNGGGLLRGVGAAVGVPSFLLVADIPTKQGLTEFLCIAMETSSRQQLGRYHRYILATLPDASEGADSTGGGSAKDNRGKEKTTGQTGGVNGSVNSYTTAVPFTTVLDELQQWMASLGLNPGAKNEKGLCEDGNFRWVVCRESGLRQIPDHLAHTYNVQVPDHLRSWTDAARVCSLLADRMLSGTPPEKNNKPTGSRRGRGGGGGKAGSGGHNGNTVGCGNSHVMHVGGEKVEAISSSILGAAVGEGDGNGSGGQRQRRQRQKQKQSHPVSTVTLDSNDGVPILQQLPMKRRRQPKKHCLPRSGLPGMFKFFEAPVAVLGCSQRGMEAAVAIAQCVACLLRHGSPLPITSRVTPVWGPGGEYQGSLYDELAPVDFDSNVTLPRVSPAIGRGTDRAPRTTLPREEMGPSTTPEVRGSFDSFLSVQETRTNERRPRERNRKRGSQSEGRRPPARNDRARSAGDGSARGVGSRGELDGGSAGPGRYRDGESDGASSIHDGDWRNDRDLVREPRQGRQRHRRTGRAGERSEDSPCAAGDRALAGSRSGAVGESYRNSYARSEIFAMPKVDSPIPDRRRVSDAAPPRESREGKRRKKKEPRVINGRMEDMRRGGAPESDGGRNGDRNREWDRNRCWDGQSGARAEGGGARDGGQDIGVPHWRQSVPENRGWSGHSGARAEGGGAPQGKHGTGMPRRLHGMPENHDRGGPFGAWAEEGGVLERGHPTGMPQWHQCTPERGGAPGVGYRNGIPHWRQHMPVKALAEDYLDYFVRDKERHYYKSAAILPYRYDPGTGEVWVLLGSEMRKNRLVLSCLGGKREDLDAGPEHTAWREFWEESGKVLGDYDRTSFLAACVEGRARALWVQSAKMTVFACELSSPGFVDLPGWYAAGTGAGVDKGDTSMLALHWVSAADLTRACHQRHGKVVVWGIAPRTPPPQQPYESEPTEMAGGAPLHWQQDRHGNHIDSSGGGGGARGGGVSAPLSLPLSLPLQLPLRPSSALPARGLTQAAAPTAVEPYPLLKNLISDRAFRVFFEHLAAAGAGRHALFAGF